MRDGVVLCLRPGIGLLDVDAWQELYRAGPDVWHCEDEAVIRIEKIPRCSRTGESEVILNVLVDWPIYQKTSGNILFVIFYGGSDFVNSSLCWGLQAASVLPEQRGIHTCIFSKGRYIDKVVAEECPDVEDEFKFKFRSLLALIQAELLLFLVALAKVADGLTGSLAVAMKAGVAVMLSRHEASEHVLACLYDYLYFLCHIHILLESDRQSISSFTEKRNTGLKPEFLIDSLQSTDWYFFRSMPPDSRSHSVFGILPEVVFGTMMKLEASCLP